MGCNCGKKTIGLTSPEAEAARQAAEDDLARRINEETQRASSGEHDVPRVLPKVIRR